MSMEVANVRNQGQHMSPSPVGHRQPRVGSSDYEIPEIERTLTEFARASGILNRRLKFSVNRELEQVVVKVIDAETDKVIKELPPEQIQRLHVRLREAIGLLVDTMI